MEYIKNLLRSVEVNFFQNVIGNFWNGKVKNKIKDASAEVGLELNLAKMKVMSTGKSQIFFKSMVKI